MKPLRVSVRLGRRVLYAQLWGSQGVRAWRLRDLGWVLMLGPLVFEYQRREAPPLPTSDALREAPNAPRRKTYPTPGRVFPLWSPRNNHPAGAIVSRRDALFRANVPTGPRTGNVEKPGTGSIWTEVPDVGY